MFFRLACALALVVVVLSGFATVGIAKDLPVASAPALSIPDAPKNEQPAAALQTGFAGDLDDPYGEHASLRVTRASAAMRGAQHRLVRRGPDPFDRALDPLERPPRA